MLMLFLCPQVVQMQRIIGYECFLENTLTAICDQIGISPDSLNINTNFITDAIRDTPIGSWISLYLATLPRRGGRGYHHLVMKLFLWSFCILNSKASIPRLCISIHIRIKNGTSKITLGLFLMSVSVSG